MTVQTKIYETIIEELQRYNGYRFVRSLRKERTTLFTLRFDLRALVRRLIRDMIAPKPSLHSRNIIHRFSSYLEARIDGDILHLRERGHINET